MLGTDTWQNRGVNGNGDGQHDEPLEPLDIVKGGDLVKRFPELRPIVVEGLLRATESMGLIAAAKMGKTFMALSLALSIATGRAWLGRVPVKQGKVLYVDCELHPETFARRLATVAAAMGIMAHEFEDAFHVVHLRGRLRDVLALGPTLFKDIPKGEYTAIFLDAMYRLYPEGFDENSNADMTRLWNAIDQYGDSTGAAFIVIHHLSKGSQAGKSVVELGSGGGAQARAPDTHGGFRQHEVDGVFVFDAAVRSFKPVTPICIEFVYPLWKVRDDLNPDDLKQPNSRRRRAKSEAETPAEPAMEWTPESFASAFVTADPTDRKSIAATAELQGVGVRRIDTLLTVAITRGIVHRWTYPKDRTVYLANREQSVIESANTLTLTHTLPPHPPSDGKRRVGRGNRGRGRGEKTNTAEVAE